MSRGKFIVLEGGEGVGKTTQADILLAKLKEHGRKAEFIREPGGDPLAEKLRELLLDPALSHEPETELLLFNAARIQTLVIVESKLNEGIDVVSDRNMLSTIAYQGYGRGLDLSTVRDVCELATKRVKPDLVLLLDAPAEVVNTRRDNRGISDRFEELGEDFHTKVREGYKVEAQILSIPIVDASPDIQEVAGLIWQKVEPLLH
jgi:dTMP kinase